MPKRVLPLSEAKIKNAKPKAAEYKLGDGYGLYLLVTPTGGKLWRFDYRFMDRRKVLALGSYPEIGLAKARQRREEARSLIADGIDPAQEKKAEKAKSLESAANTFEAVAREWMDKYGRDWTEGHKVTVVSRLEKDIFPAVGARPILEITAPELLRALRVIEARGALEVARRTRQICTQVFQYAVACGKADRNPAADLKGAIAPPKQRHFSSITDPKAFGALLRAIEGYDGSFVTKCALRLAPLVFVRPGELRSAEWAEFDLEEMVWTIPAEKMKMRRPHIVPLSKQAVEIIREAQPLTGKGKYLFPSMRGAARCMSNNTLNAAMRRLGFSADEVTAHGFRSSASTMLHEMGWRSDVIERQLAHIEQNKIKGAYNRAEHLPERRKMMQTWADYLEGLREGAKVIPFRHGAAG